MLGSFNNWNIVQFTNKIASIKDFYEVHKVVLERISDDMASLVQLVKRGAINSSETTTMGYYGIKYLSETYTLQEDQTTDGQVNNAGKILVKTEYLSIMKSRKHWYWKQHIKIIVS